jgi:hypothetical protein
MDAEVQRELLALQAVPVLAALLRHAVRNESIAPVADGVRVTLTTEGLDVEFLHGDVALFGIGFEA